MGYSALTTDSVFAFTLHDVSRRFITSARSATSISRRNA
jgi:hypothetical protein